MISNKLIILLVLVLLLSVNAIGNDEHDGHDNHENESVSTVQEVDDHGISPDGCDNEKHDEIVVRLTHEAQEMVGLTLSRVVKGNIVKTSELSGEIVFNDERFVHIAPRFAGIALEAHCRVGSYVNAGDVVAVVESNESMNSYSITAPISGWIIKRHITPGEYVSQENSIFILADLSTVWVNLAVYPKDAGFVRSGQEVLITVIGSQQQVTGTIDFVTPMLDVNTRSSTARVVLPNPDNLWCPGTFVHAQVVTASGEEGLVVEKEAVQFIGEESVVFIVEDHDKFVAVDVVIGDSDDKYVRILEGLPEGTEYVAAGAFELKARVVTSSLSGHAGHGH